MKFPSYGRPEGHSPVARRFLATWVIAALAIAFVPVIAIAPPLPLGDSWYVDDMNGDDLLGDGSAGNPFATITSALATASPGDTIMVEPGYYDNEDFPLLPEDGQTIVSTGGSDVTTISAEWASGVFVLDQVEGVTIEGLSIIRGMQEIGGGIHAKSASAVVRDCYFGENLAAVGGAICAEHALFFEEGPNTSCDLVVDDCTFESNGWEVVFGPELKESAAPSLMPAAVEPTMPPEPDFWPEDIATYEGGALACFDASVTITGSHFTDNAALVLGGAVASLDSTMTVFETSFYENYSYNEGGVFGARYAGAYGLDALEGARSRAAQFGGEDAMGGGLFAWGGKADVRDSVFWRNFSMWGGGAFFSHDTTATVEGCAVEENSAVIGGGIANTSPEWIWGSGGGNIRAASRDDDPQALLQAAIEGNPLVAENGFIEGTLDVNHSILKGNGAWLGIPAVFAYSYPSTYENCLFAQNVGEMATAYLIDVFGGSWLNHCTFADNARQEAALIIVDDGGFTASGLVTNSVFWGNRYEERLLADVYGSSVYYSDLQYGFMGSGETDSTSIDAAITDPWGNISEDPLYYDPIAGEYQLTFGSPCVDTALDEAGADDDLIGVARPIDGDLNGSDDYDMGCYELSPRNEGNTATIGGASRYATSVRVSRAFFPSADTVFIARSDKFADGLTVAGLAGIYDGPVLLSDRTTLPRSIRREIRRLGASKAFVLGNGRSIGGAVARKLRDMGLEVERIGGGNRYDTAALIAERIIEESGDTTPPVTFIARGDQWPDALAVSPVANALEAPILLVRPGELPNRTVDILEEYAPVSSIFVGGKEAVSAHVAKAISAAALSSTRVGGANKYATAAAVSQYAVDQGWSSWARTGLATGADFTDALVAGPCVGRLGGVLLLTNPDSLSAPTRTALASDAYDIVRLDIFGSKSISTAVQVEAAGLLP